MESFEANFTSFFLLLFFSFLGNVLAFRWGFFQTKENWRPFCSSYTLLFSFSFFFSQFFLKYLSFYGKPLYSGVIHVFLFLIYLLIRRKEISSLIREKKEPLRFFSNLLFSIPAVFILIPTAGAAQQGTQLLLSSLFGIKSQLQDAFHHIQRIKEDPAQMYIYFFLICIVAPLLEEFIFRGVLQNWLKRFLSIPMAISVTSFIFSICHFGTVSGVGGKLATLAPLFIASLYLGQVYEVRRSLLAPIFLHMGLNASSFTFALCFSS